MKRRARPWPTAAMRQDETCTRANTTHPTTGLRAGVRALGHSKNRSSSYVSCSNPVNAGRSPYNSEPSFEKPERSSPPRRRKPRSAVPSKICHASWPLRCPRISRRPIGASPHAPATDHGVGHLFARAPGTRSSTNCGRCRPRLELRTQVTVRNELELWVRSRKKPAKLH
jgi:hypothetical protein